MVTLLSKEEAVVQPIS